MALFRKQSGDDLCHNGYFVRMILGLWIPRWRLAIATTHQTLCLACLLWMKSAWRLYCHWTLAFPARSGVDDVWPLYFIKFQRVTFEAVCLLIGWQVFGDLWRSVFCSALPLKAALDRNYFRLLCRSLHLCLPWRSVAGHFGSPLFCSSVSTWVAGSENFEPRKYLHQLSEYISSVFQIAEPLNETNRPPPSLNFALFKWGWKPSPGGVVQIVLFCILSEYWALTQK